MSADAQDETGTYRPYEVRTVDLRDEARVLEPGQSIEVSTSEWPYASGQAGHFTVTATTEIEIA